MGAKIRHGNQIYDMLADLIFNLSPNQAEALYAELLPRYTRRGRVTMYNVNGEEDQNGKIRLMPHQYKAIRTEFGDTYIKKAFTELTSYIEFLQAHLKDNYSYAQKLKKLNSGTHNVVLTSKDSWLYNKCKSFIITNRPKAVNLNPYLIDDINTAREYIRTLPKEYKEEMDVQMLLIRFPELASELYGKE